MRNHCKYLSVTSRHAVDSNAGKDMDATDPLKDSAIKGTANDGQSSSRPLSSSPIDISDNCVKRLKKVLDKKEEMLRVEVLSGGCSGLEYRFHVTDKTTAEDVVFEKNGVKVVVDNESMQYLNGSTIDYSEELIKSSFRVLNNPQSQQGCSCGQSFALKLDNGFKFKT
ncbi:unnamed protein product [Medioppia subpectinata]|uniref:Iron-sulfur cluster assembly 2 homolog, mitochondrial n=1 Tax=Medioppia subpectinata TaxID=1979941 RepID=A0A7R9LN53_9ACAR|nr:unnamed protein product [Medioppia subpectinata]CAG2119933.1 unnamed protein product [Medioppia subpectinata]